MEKEFTKLRRKSFFVSILKVFLVCLLIVQFVLMLNNCLDFWVFFVTGVFTYGVFSYSHYGIPFEFFALAKQDNEGYIEGLLEEVVKEEKVRRK